ncbi:hypothetical protein GJAV_G00215760 [Gymnothorax javanicus]|nr:hypothetical protein GJAV_G00215760 [Gymnothorax javanicus]
MPTTRMRKRPRPSYFRKKEVAEITKRAEEERAVAWNQSVLERSKGHQVSVKMVDRRVGNHKYRRTCKLQVKPITVSIETQVNLKIDKECNSAMQEVRPLRAVLLCGWKIQLLMLTSIKGQMKHQMKDQTNLMS